MALAIWLQMILEGKGDSYVPETSDDLIIRKQRTNIDRPDLDYTDMEEDEYRDSITCEYSE